MNKTRTQELLKMLTELSADADHLIMTNGDRDTIWKLVDLRTKYLIELHDLTGGDNEFEHQIKSEKYTPLE